MTITYDTADAAGLCLNVANLFLCIVNGVRDADELHASLVDEDGRHRDANYPLRRQRQMCIRDGLSPP